MKKKGMSIGGAIAIGIGGIVFLVIEWVVVFLLTGILVANNITNEVGNLIPEIDLNESINDDYKVEESEYTDYKIYENKELGIKFRYPKEFDQTKEEESGGYKTILFYNSTTGSGVNLVTGDTTGVFSFDAYITASMDSLKQSYNLTDDDIEIDKSDIYMGGKTAFKNYYVYSGVNIYQCATLEGVTEYVLTYSGNDANFDKQVGDKIFSSFEFIEESLSEEETEVASGTGTSKENPANLDEWCVASKYNPSNNKYQDVKIKVTKITRGDEATQIVKEYSDTDKYFDYEDPKEGEEWVVIEYDVDMQNFDIPSHGTSPYLTVNVVGTDKYNSIKYNGKSYYATVDRVSSIDYVKTTNVSNKVATTLPVGCTDYLVQFGAYNETIAYVKGK